MVSCEPFQSYKVPLKTNGQSIIEHNLVTIYMNLEWPENINENPNLIIHIIDKKTSSKPCKNDSSMSYFQQNQSSLLVNSIHHHHHHHQQQQQQQQQQNFGPSYQPPPPPQQHQQYYHPSSVPNNEPPSTTTTLASAGDHNDVSSTTTTVVFSALPAQPLRPPSSVSHTPLHQIKNEVKTQLSPIYRRQQTPTSPSACSSTNQPYLSSQHVIQTPSSDMETQSNLQMAPLSKSISSTSLTNLPTKQTLIHPNDLQQISSIPAYPLSSSSASSTVKAFVCTCSKPHLVHEQTCPTLTLIKQQSNAAAAAAAALASQTIICRPPINRTIAQRAAVASQIRTNRSISMTPIKEQGQTPSTTLLPFAIPNMKTSDSPPNIPTIVSQQQQQQSNFPTIKKSINRQRSIGAVNNRQRKRRITKQLSVPNAINHDQTSFYNQINLNETKQQQPPSAFLIKEERLSSPNPATKSPTIKLVSPYSIQTTISNSDIDQTIEEVINGKGDISINESSHLHTKVHHPRPPSQPQPTQQPSSQLVWVQNGTVTTKTWLSPLYQKQQAQQSDYDSIGSTLTHQDVVNIAQQVVFPTNNEQNQMNTVLQPTLANNSKKRNRSKSTTNVTLKRNRNRKSLLNRPQSAAITSQQEIGKSTTSSPITPTLNLINKPVTWSNIPATSGFVTTTLPLPPTATTNPSLLTSHQHLSSSFDKNDSWQTHCVENVDSMLDEFQLVSIDEQRMNSNPHLDFDLSTDGFSSKTNDQFGALTPPPPLRTTDNPRYTLSSTDKLLNPSINNSRLSTGDVDVYEHFLNPYSSSMWQENQVTSSVSTPPDFQLNTFSFHQHQQQQQQQQAQLHHHHQGQQQAQQQQQQYYSSQINDEHFDSYHLPSQVRLLFDVQS